jgi:LysM repeat protein
MKRHHLILLLIALLAGLAIALLTHSAAAGAPARLTATLQPTPVIYVVQRGDTLFAIGRRFGVNPYDIARANNIINPNLIYPGQSLIIPTGGVVWPPTPPPPTTATATPTPPSGGVITYVVQRGDTLYRIALRFGTTIAALRAANNLHNTNLIYVGQVLIIPIGSTPPTATPVGPTRTPTPTPIGPTATHTRTPGPTATFAFPTPTIKDISAAFEPFERGFMIWLGDRRRIWIAACCTSTIPLQGRWLVFDDAWVEGLPADDPSIVPPPGLYQPVRGFGLVWRTLRDYSYGGTIRDLLGWATAPEQGYTAHVEYHPGGYFDPDGHFIARPGTWTINTPDGKRYYFHEAGPAWSLIQP